MILNVPWKNNLAVWIKKFDIINLTLEDLVYRNAFTDGRSSCIL